MKILRDSFISILEKVELAIPTDKFISQNPYFIFTGKDIIGYNDRVGVVNTFKTDFKCMVPAGELIPIVKRLKANNVELSFDEKEKIFSFKCGNVKSSLKAFEYDPSIAEVLPDRKVLWNKLPKNFIEGLTLTAFSCSSDMTKPYLTCLSIGNNKIVSSDNLRISMFTFKEKLLEDKFLLPLSSALKIIKFDIDGYVIHNDWAMFRSTDGAVVYSRLMKGKYPNVKKFFEVFLDKKIKWITLPKEMKNSIELSELFAEGIYDFDKRVKIEFKRKKIICMGKKETGTIECRVDSLVGIDATIFVNPTFFKQAFEHAVKISHYKNYLLFKSGSFKHVMLLYKGE